jgi:hypothetical protein
MEQNLTYYVDREKDGFRYATHCEKGPKKGGAADRIRLGIV